MDKLIIIVSALLILSIFASKAASRFGVPSLLMFLVVGILAGPYGIGGLEFHNVALTQGLAIVSLCFILFSGGMDTDLKEIKPILKPGLVLSTIGVLIAALAVSWFSIQFLHLSKSTALLLGAIVASTDVAAVFTVLRSRNISLKGGIKPLLEFESAVNDPMSVFLCVGLLQTYSLNSNASLLQLVPMFFKQMILGGYMGWLGGRAAKFVINRLRLEFEGLYSSLSLALVLLIYGLTQFMGASGFLAVYIAGIYLGNGNFQHKKSLTHFHDALAWLMQIAMFLTMGLLVSPSELSDITFSGVLLAAFLIFVARPLSVFLCLLPFRIPARETLMIAWAGLRGAVPIILATYPLTAGIPEARLIFNLVFFVVLTSVLFQGASIAPVARLLGVNAPLKNQARSPH